MKKIKKHILGLSDSSSFFMELWRPAHYLNLMIKLSKKINPTICYIGAARGDESKRIAEFYVLSKHVEFTPVCLNLFEMQTDDPESYFANVDIIYIDGGSTRNLLALMQEWQVDLALGKAYESGVLVVGASAGVSVLFEWCMTDSVRTEIRPTIGLGVLKGSVCVHFNSRLERQTAFKKFLHTSQAEFPAYAIEDGVSMYLVDGELTDVYTLSEDNSLFEYSDKELINSTRYPAKVLSI